MAYSLWPLLTVIILACPSLHVIAQHDRTHNRSTVYSQYQPSLTPSICEARTINYITNSLPQLCLTNSWVSTSFTLDGTSTFVPPTTTIESSNTPLNTTGLASAELSASQTNHPSTGESAEDGTAADPSATTFMSFEEWKEMMLRQAGQDPQDLKHRKSTHRARERPPDLGPFGIGDEEEISLDFDNYLPKSGHGHKGSTESNGDSDVTEYAHVYESDTTSIHRSKDAGKTCKERFSYASFDAGATVLKTGPGTKNAKAILVEHKDSYMLLECSRQGKHVIVELSDDILIDTIVLANFEFFSSMIRHFRVSVSDRYPVKVDRWRTIGTFEARNSRDIQPFLVDNPQIWAKYVRIEFLSHYGNEYYCPVSLLRVHGSRMLESWRDIETGRDDGVDEDEDYDVAGIAPEAYNCESCSVSQDPLGDSQPPSSYDADAFGRTSLASHCDDQSYPCSETFNDFSFWPVTQAPFFLDNGTCPISLSFTSEVPRECSYSNSVASNIRASTLAHEEGFQDEDTTAVLPVSLVNGTTSVPTSTTLDASTVSSPQRTTSQHKPPSASQNAPREPPDDVGASTATSSYARTSPVPSPGSKQRVGASGGPSSPSTVQEGFFNAVTKRLHNVETNLTLSLQYLEDQSRHLQDAFHKAEKQQLLKVTNFLDTLNQTVFQELRGMRMQYDQIWQSTVIALESQREQSERDIVALGTRLNVLADEVVFQKRMAIVQAVLLLCCLFLVIFSRGVPIPYIAPLLDQHTTSGFDTPPVAVATATPSYVAGRIPLDRNEQRPMESFHLNESHKDLCRPVPQHTVLSEAKRQAETQAADNLSLPTTLVHRDGDTDGVESAMAALETHGTPLHRPQGYQSSHCRKPLPALPEHPSPAS